MSVQCGARGRRLGGGGGRVGRGCKSSQERIIESDEKTGTVYLGLSYIYMHHAMTYAHSPHTTRQSTDHLLARIGSYSRCTTRRWMAVAPRGVSSRLVSRSSRVYLSIIGAQGEIEPVVASSLCATLL